MTRLTDEQIELLRVPTRNVLTVFMLEMGMNGPDKVEWLRDYDAVFTELRDLRAALATIDTHLTRATLAVGVQSTMRIDRTTFEEDLSAAYMALPRVQTMASEED